MTKYTRDQVIEIVGLAAVEALDRINCEPTSRLYNHDEGEIEWSASLNLDHDDYDTLTAYYYTTAADARKVEDFGGDWGSINWEIDHYTLS